jgi:hypothetical protein
MHDIAAGHDKHAALAQRTELRAQVQVVIERLVSVD